MGRPKIRDIQNFLGQMMSSDVDRLLRMIDENIDYMPFV